MKKQVFASILVILCLAILSVGPVSAQSSEYTFIDLGTLGGQTSRAVAINNKGQVTGYSITATGNTHAFLWEKGSLMDLGTLGGTYSAAFTLNDLGQVVGTSSTASGEYHAFLWEKGVMRDLGTLGGTASSAYDINNLGQVVGSSRTASGESHAFRWQDNTMADLGSLGGTFCTALDINESGLIVGYGYDPSDYTHALLWENGIMTDLGTLGNVYTRNIARAINENRQIIGVSSNDSILSERAFLYENGQMTDLGTLGGPASLVTEINNLGQVAGTSLLWNEIQHGYLWENGTMTDLYPNGGHFETSDINEHGQVVGSLNNSHAYLWENGIMNDLGVPQGWQSSSATAINENGLIVGSVSLTSGMDNIYHAALWAPLSFVDVLVTHPYYQDIEILYANGLTAGCQTSPLKYCPDQIMNRGQAAVFMLRANFGSSYVPPMPTHIFQDDWTKGPWAEPWAEGMKLGGLSAGCQTSPLKYCPWSQIPREQAVIFALRMKYGTLYTPPPATGTVFADMTNPSYYATAWAEQAYKDGLIQSCGTSGGKPKFCPKNLVSRGLAAYMIVRAKNLTMP